MKVHGIIARPADRPGVARERLPALGHAVAGAVLGGGAVVVSFTLCSRDKKRDWTKACVCMPVNGKRNSVSNCPPKRLVEPQFPPRQTTNQARNREEARTGGTAPIESVLRAEAVRSRSTTATGTPVRHRPCSAVAPRKEIGTQATVRVAVALWTSAHVVGATARNAINRTCCVSPGR